MLSFADRCVQMKVSKHGGGVLDSRVFLRNVDFYRNKRSFSALTYRHVKTGGWKSFRKLNALTFSCLGEAM